jgi:hypothetical protein
MGRSLANNATPIKTPLQRDCEFRRHLPRRLNRGPYLDLREHRQKEALQGSLVYADLVSSGGPLEEVTDTSMSPVIVGHRQKWYVSV